MQEQASSISAEHAQLESSYSSLRERHKVVDSDLLFLQIVHSQLDKAHTARGLELAEVEDRLLEVTLRHTEAEAALRDLQTGKAALAVQLKQASLLAALWSHSLR